jgi:hypothetical protein
MEAVPHFLAVNCYVIPNSKKLIKLRRVRWEGSVARMKDVCKTYTTFSLLKSEGRRFEICRRRCDYNIKMASKGIRSELDSAFSV